MRFSLNTEPFYPTFLNHAQYAPLVPLENNKNLSVSLWVKWVYLKMYMAMIWVKFYDGEDNLKGEFYARNYTQNIEIWGKIIGELGGTMY